MKKLIVIAVFLFSVISSYGQCSLVLKGAIYDEDHLSAPDVTLRLIHEGDTLLVQTDDTGHYEVGNLCPGIYQISMSEPEFSKLIKNLSLYSDTVLNLNVHSRNPEMEEVVNIIGSVDPSPIKTLVGDQLTGRDLFNARGENLGEMLKNLPGVNAMQSGPTISKPVIHGMYGPRVLIINNGVRLEGQNWANDHAPELDPFISSNITVLKGAASVRYGADAEGGVVLMDPPPLPKNRGIGGDVYMVGATNGRSGTLSGDLQGALVDTVHDNTFSWRAQGTLKAAGNFKTPNYYLYNTGVREGDFSLNAAFRHKNWDINAWYSQYHYKAGIFSGAESGNMDELLQKFQLTRPLTPDVFMYKIQKSYQLVTHNTLKTSATYRLANGDKWLINWATQNDDRREYDDDAPYNPNQANSGLPAIQFNLNTQTTELIYDRRLRNNWSGMFGFTGLTQGNKNTFVGVTTLLPNFRTYTGGLFGIIRYYLKNWTFEAGVRGDYERMDVYRYQNNSDYNYGNLTGTIGAGYQLTSSVNIKFNSGIAWRAPSISEMFIKGTHLADAMYMLGDSSLKSEKAWNNILSLNYHTGNLDITADGYINTINNYIYARPMPNPVILVGGAFLGFQYVQSNVTIKGLDLNIRYDLLPWVSFISKTSIVRGFNHSEDNYLIYMPADRFQNGLDFHLPRLGRLMAPYIEIENVSVGHQNRYPANEDFVVPPKAYSLFNATAGFDLEAGRNKFSLSLSATNVTNTAYRDYLDMFRYYNDALGSNYTLRLRWNF